MGIAAAVALACSAAGGAEPASSPIPGGPVPVAPSMDAARKAALRADARRYFAEALVAARSLKSTVDRDDALCDWAQAQARQGNYKAAAKVGREIRSALLRDWVWNAIGVERAWRGEIAEARRALARVRDKNVRSDIKRGIAAAQARQGDFAGALATVESMEKPGSYVFTDPLGVELDYAVPLEHGAMLAILEAQLTAGDLAAAKKTASDLVLPVVQGFAAGRIAETMAQAGDVAGARVVADSLTHPEARAVAERRLGTALARAGDAGGARAAFAEAQAAVAIMTTPRDRSRFLADIAVAQAAAGEGGEAAAGFARAREEAAEVVDADPRAYALAFIAGQQARARDVSDAVATIDTIEVAKARDSALRQIVEWRAKAADLDGAKAMAGEIIDAFLQETARREITKAQAWLRGPASVEAQVKKLANPQARFEHLLALAKVAAAEARGQTEAEARGLD